MPTVVLELVVTLFTALLAGSYFGTSLVDVPAQRFLSAASYVEIQQAGTRLGTIRYRALVLTTVVSQLAVLAYLRVWSSQLFQLNLLSLLFVIGGLLVTVLLVVPINAEAHTWSPAAPPGNWRAMQAKWHTFHYLRTALVLVAFILQLTALSSLM
jgi:uncharacterized membrane protein